MNCIECDFKGLSQDDFDLHVAETHIFKDLFSIIAKEKDGEKLKDMKDMKEDKSLEKSNRRKYSVSDVKYTCESCNYSTNFQPNLFRHTDTTHLKKVKFGCNLCDYKAYQEHHVKQHQDAKQHLGKIIELDCSFCQQNIEHTVHKRKECSLCHQNIEHSRHYSREKYKRKTIDCQQEGCNYSTSSKIVLQKHYNRHIANKKVKNRRIKKKLKRIRLESFKSKSKEEWKICVWRRIL